jgi:hypothetical protein
LTISSVPANPPATKGNCRKTLLGSDFVISH